MNQGTLEVVKQVMVRVSIDIIGISKLEWTWLGGLIHMTNISTAMGKNTLEEMV